MSQSQREIEDFYHRKDPWGFETNPHDKFRKERIISAAAECGKPKRLLDIGAGEGWITKDICAHERFGYEISDKARARFPKEVTACTNPEGKYDLIIVTGVLYTHYDYKKMIQMINDHASEYIITCHIKDWEIKDICDQIKAKVVSATDFPYREYVQKLRVFKK